MGLPIKKKDDAETVEELDPASPAPEPAAEPAPPPPAAAAPAPTLAPEEPAPPQEQAPAPQPAAAPPKPAVMPNAGTIDVIGQRKPPPTPQEVAQDMTNHDLEFQRDMAMGHIKPETYQSLFAKKDTLGKIGTLFGLLVSGAGAGLTHQPNAVLEMMNKQITNDFDAQKSQQTGAQNWYNLSRQHEMNKAQIEQMGVQNIATLTQASKVPAEIKSLEAGAASARADVDLKSTTSAINRMKMSAVQSLQDQANKLPPGPQQQQFQNAVNLMSNAVQQDVNKNNLATADQIAARKKLRGEDGSVASDPGVDMQKFNALVAQSRANESLGMPSMVNEGDIQKASQEATQIADNRVIAKIYNDSFKKLDKAFAADVLNKQDRAAMLSTLGAEIARATAGRYNAAEAAAQADGMFPSFKDWGGSRANKYRKAMEYFEGQEAGTTTINRLGIKTPFPFAMRSKETGKKEVDGKTQEGAVAKNKQGQRMIFKGGKWSPMGQTQQATK